MVSQGSNKTLSPLPPPLTSPDSASLYMFLLFRKKLVLMFIYVIIYSISL